MPLARQDSASSVEDAPTTKQDTTRLSLTDSSSQRDLKTSDVADVDDSIVRAEGEERTTAFVWFLVTAAATGGLLFGFDVSWPPSVCVQLRADLPGFVDWRHRRRSRPQRHRS